MSSFVVITVVYETLKDQTAKGAWPCSDKTTDKEQYTCTHKI